MEDGAIEFQKMAQKQIARATGGREQFIGEGGTEKHLLTQQVNFANNPELNYLVRETSEPEELKQIQSQEDLSDDDDADFREQLDY